MKTFIRGTSPVVSRAVLLLLLLTCVALAQTHSTSVELFGTIPAAQALNGLGFNLDADQEWEWAAAAAAGATHARFQCSWAAVEKQTAPPLNVPSVPQYIQESKCDQGYRFALKYSIHPTVVAAYGPPYHQLLTVSIPAGASVGAKTVHVVLSSAVGGSRLKNIRFPYAYIQGPPHRAPKYGRLTARGSYQGTLITRIDISDETHAVLSLASALTIALPADDTPYTVNEVLYPSTATTSPSDPSVIAYANYVTFLARDMASHGVSGDIELWNEPPWNPDPWDNRCALYDPDSSPPCPASPGPANAGTPNYGFAAVLQARPLPPGITLTWNGTSGSGEASLLGPRMLGSTGVYAIEPARVITAESFHPYGNQPEANLFVTACLESTIASYPAYPTSRFSNCYLPGEPNTSNLMAAIQFSMVSQRRNGPASGLAHSVTETGALPSTPGYRMNQARFIMRQFLGFEADGITPIEFYKLYDASVQTDPNFSFVQHVDTGSRYIANPSYTALSGLMNDLRVIAYPSTSTTSRSLPQVTQYSGTFPLSTMHMVGSRFGAKANSDMYVVWQRSYSDCDTHGHCNPWITQVSPPPAPVTVTLPPNMGVAHVTDLVTRRELTYTSANRQVTFEVADNPVALLVDPLR